MQLSTKHGAAIIGCATGDTLGLPYEFRSLPSSPDAIKQLGLCWSDDTQQSLVLLDDFLRHGSLDYLRVMNRFRQYWFDDSYPHPKGCGLHRGTGGRFRDAVRSWSVDGVISPRNSSGNGAAMRVAPVAFAMNDSEQNLRAIRLVSSCTHGETLGIAAAEAVTLAAWALRSGLRGDAVLVEVANRVSEPRMHAHLLRLVGTKDFQGAILASTGMPAGSAYALCGPVSAIVVSSRSESVDQAIVEAIMLGQDTDSTAAIAGALAAGAYGAESIPEQWLDFPESGSLSAWDAEVLNTNDDLIVEIETRLSGLRAVGKGGR